jgi:Tol biopolymer transport system component
MKYTKSFLLVVFFLSSCVPVATATSTPTQTFTPAPTATQTPKPTPTITPTPTQIGGGSGKFIFEYYKAGFEKSFPDLKGEINIFTSNLDGTNLTSITNGLKDFNRIENISTNGQMILVSSRSSLQAKGDLYLIHLDLLNSAPIKLASGLLGGGQAIFLDNTRIVYISQGLEGYGFYVANIDGTNPKKIGAPTGTAWGIKSSDKTRIYWSTIKKENFKDSSGVLYQYGDYASLWWTNIDGSGQGKLESNGQQILGYQYAFSPDGTSIAWIPAGLEQGCSLLSGLVIWSPYIRNGNLTIGLSKPSMFINKNSPHLGKTIDIAYVEDYVRHCFLMHFASLSNMDSDINIPLIPPFNPAKDDFFYHKEYYLSWFPDSSKVLAYDGGDPVRYYYKDITDHYPIALYEVSLNDSNPKLALLKILSNNLDDVFNLPSFSSDGRQILFTKYDNHYDKPMINILNLETMNYANDFAININPNSQAERIGNIYWLP